MPAPSEILPNLTRPEENGRLAGAYSADRTQQATNEAVQRMQSLVKQPPNPAQPAAVATGQQDQQQQDGFFAHPLNSIGKFVTDLPLQTIGGLRDAAQGVADTGRGVAEALQSIGIPDAYIQFTDPQTGELDLKLLSPEGAKAAGLKPLTMPNIPQGKTFGSELYRKMVQFVVPFSRVSKLLGASQAGAALGKVGTDLVAGAISDLTFWQAQDGRLSDLIQSVPALQNPVSDFLSSKADDTILESKMKTALEGAGLGAFVHSFTSGVRHMRAVIKAQKAAKAAETAGKVVTPTAEDLAKQAASQLDTDLAKSALGDAKAPAVKFEALTPEHADLIRRNMPANDSLGGMQSLYKPDAISPAGVKAASKTAGTKVPLNDIGRPVVNFSAINSSDDVTNVLKEMTNRLQDTARAAKGGVVSHAETIALAKNTGIDQLLQGGVDVSRMNRGEMLALKDLYAASGEKLIQIADEAVKAPTEGNLWAFRKMLATHDEIYGRFVGAKAEAGRTLNALAIPSGAGSSERLSAIQDVLDAMGGPEVSHELAARISSLRNAAPGTLSKVVQKSVTARTLDAVREAWTLGLVSSPYSQARNILSNTAFMYQNIAERGLAARIPGATVQHGEALAYTFGTLKSLKQGFINAGKSFRSGQSGYGIGKIDLPYRRAISSESLNLHGPMGRIADVMGSFYATFGKALTAGDELFKTMNYNGELWAQAVRRAPKGLNRGDFAEAVAKLAMNPDEAMRMAATDAAHYGTFTQALGNQGQAYMKLRNAHPVFTFLTPFVRTPGNIFKAGFERSPMAVFMPRTFWDAVKAGGAQRDLALARVTMGSAVMALFADLTDRGVVTGRGPLDPTERANLRNTGWQPYSVNIGKIQGGQDKFINYRSIEPLGMVLGLGADVTELLSQYSNYTDSDNPADQDKATRIASVAVAAVANSVVSDTFVRSVSDFFNMMDNPAMNMDRWLEGYVATALPRLSATTARIVDPTLRETYSTMDTFAAEIPGMSSKLYPRRDLWGHPIELSGSLGPDWISPIWMSESHDSPIAQELVNQQIHIARVGRTASFTDPRLGQSVAVNLNNYPAAYDRLVELAGNKLKHPAFGLGCEALLNKIVEGKHTLSAIYQRLPDGDEPGIQDKGAFIKNIVSEYRQLAKDEVVKEFPDLRKEIDRRALRKFNMQTQGLR